MPAILALAGPAAASATVRYVAKNGKDNPSCSQAEPCLTVEHSITVAQPGDTISIGPGTFAEGEITVSKQLNFVGAGSGTASSYEPLHDTLIDGSGKPESTIFDYAGGSFSNLRLNGGVSGFGPFAETYPALYLQASGGAGSVAFTVNNVVATQPPVPVGGGADDGAVELEAVFTYTNTATITNLTAIGAGAALNVSANGTQNLNLSHATLTSLGEEHGPAALSLGSANAQVSNTTASGTAVGADLYGGQLTATNSSFLGTSDGVTAHTNEKRTISVNLRDSLAAALPTSNLSSQAGALLSSEGGAGAIVNLAATNSTIAAYGKGASAGLSLKSTGSSAATASLGNTIAFGADPTAPGTPRDIIASGPGTATVSAASSGYSSVNATSGATITPVGGAGNVSGNPAFLGPASGNFMLGSGSPLLLRGNPALVQAGELDLAGSARVPNDCGVTLNPDIGAYELQRTFLCPVASAAPSVAGTGTANVLHGLPVIGAASISASRTARGHRHGRPGRLLFSLNEAAGVSLTLKRISSGHLRRKACVAKASRKACKRLVTVNLTTVTGKAGANTVAFPSVKLLRHLKPGPYEVLLAAVNAQRVRSATRTVKFMLR